MNLMFGKIYLLFCLLFCIFLVSQLFSAAFAIDDSFKNLAYETILCLHYTVHMIVFAPQFSFLFVGVTKWRISHQSPLLLDAVDQSAVADLYTHYATFVFDTILKEWAVTVCIDKTQRYLTFFLILYWYFIFPCLHNL